MERRFGHGVPKSSRARRLTERLVEGRDDKKPRIARLHQLPGGPVYDQIEAVLGAAPEW